MIKEFKIPSPGESITEVEVASWMVEDGAFVEKNDELAEVESDKATLVLVAEEDGVISIIAQVGETVAVGSIAYTLDTDAKGIKKDKTEVREETKPKAKLESKTEPKVEEKSIENTQVKVTPVAAEMMKENQLNVDDIIKGLKRITKQEVQTVLSNPNNSAGPITEVNVNKFSRNEDRSKMTTLRKRLSERLVSVKNETAMLTTFNEVDMSTVMGLRKSLQNKFVEKHEFKLGFMGFFTKAVSIAARHFPAVNSRIEGDETVSFSYVDVGIAVQSPKGLMVPIVRNAESKSIVEIEKDIKILAQKARDRKISVEELSGGTISITNGGVFGSLMSTPILNPPQSAILGMHNIVDRPIALNGQVVIRPMMYIALSYDHRIVDGKDSVGFLKMVKDLIEAPENMLFNGSNPIEKLLDL
ncbi:MAG: 2-oxoglutarate dehydrogenase complex dihydrolipoyllysine-residue succinyltransferase [Prolixibacteraceae bacterium]|jgi:2-oxoglutarate dehydrogenase E2 component (dihydrolipoamide succinyltransferase)|nr:2-oxoglutarate dehydrogenase complex dihydrolipoyllysine-residue succinyltransferase [Prolixibacteraceae bacterium]